MSATIASLAMCEFSDASCTPLISSRFSLNTKFLTVKSGDVQPYNFRIERHFPPRVGLDAVIYDTAARNEYHALLPLGHCPKAPGFYFMFFLYILDFMLTISDSEPTNSPVILKSVGGVSQYGDDDWDEDWDKENGEET